MLISLNRVRFNVLLFMPYNITPTIQSFHIANTQFSVVIEIF